MKKKIYILLFLVVLLIGCQKDVTEVGVSENIIDENNKTGTIKDPDLSENIINDKKEEMDSCENFTDLTNTENKEII